MTFLENFTNVEFVYSTIVRIFSIGIIISSIEYIARQNDYSDEGIFSWKVLKLTPAVLKNPLYKSQYDFFFKKNSFLILSYLRLLSSLVLVLSPTSQCSIYCFTILAVSSFFLNFRNSIGNDGSDQMNTVVCLVLFISSISNNIQISILGLFFIAAQAVLSYFAAGLAKFIGISWRNGMAIYEIMNTESYGYMPLANFLRKNSSIYTKIINWNIIIFECFFILIIILPTPYFLIFVIWGFFFHMFNAIFMGLNGFLWAFMASYPAIIFVNLYLWKIHCFI